MTDIVVPELGESVLEARVARWMKKEGEHVGVGEPLVELETEKVNLEVNAERAGVVASIRRQEGEDVKIGDILGSVDESATEAMPSGSGPSAAPAPPAATPTSGPVAAASAPSDPPPSVPVAEIPASDPPMPARGVGATRAPVAAPFAGAALPAPVPEPAPSKPVSPPPPTPRATAAAVAAAPRRAPGERPEERQRMTKRRATIARRLVEGQHNAAMLTTFNEVDMTAVMALRERHKEAFKTRFGVSLGIASFFVKVSVAALRAFPQLNAEIQGDEIVLKRYYDIGIAVGAEGGLVVPVLRDADQMSFAQIEHAIRNYAKSATSGTLTLQDLAGGTFTITNGGVFGSLLSTPILNPPQVAILGLHKIQDRPVGVNGQVALRPMMYVALSYDHRIVDGREAVQFLVKVKAHIEDPAQLLFEG